ncbi:MAG: hypothetical protein K2X47_18375, partial [Bdellovibrionales bacterium]|nr:hypothetical protein [Bdellovibrionales bacterium]
LRNATAQIWEGKNLQQDFLGAKSWKKIALLFSIEAWNVVNVVRVISAVGALWSPSLWGVITLFLCHFFSLLRWRGSFNGGSDSMMLYVFGGTLLGLLARQNPIGPQIALWFIALTLTFSYLKPGILKLVNKNWRSGNALKVFLTSSAYRPSTSTSLISEKKIVLVATGWGLILFEVCFPLAFLGPHWAIFFIAIGLCFHIATAYLFGLNRFLFAWICAYPALVYCAA